MSFLKKHSLTTKYLLLILGLVLCAPILLAQGSGDALLDETDDVLSSEEIDVDGNFKRKKTAADRLAEQRKRLEQRNQDMVSKKIEDIRMREERKLAKKLRSAFSGDNFSDDVSLQQSAAIVSAPAPIAAEEKEETTIKVIPYGGIMNISSQKDGKNIDFESNVSTGISVETMVSKKISVGVGFNFASLEIEEIDPDFFGGSSCGFYGCNSLDGRELNYKRMGFEINSKFFFIQGKKILPYAGLALVYNRTHLEYEDQPQNYSGFGFQNLGDEEFRSSYVSGAALVGAEIRFGQTIGAILEFRYQKAISDGFNTSSAGSQSLDQDRLDALGAAIEESDSTAIRAGLVVHF
jgi:hypothetical protein